MANPDGNKTFAGETISDQTAPDAVQGAENDRLISLGKISADMVPNPIAGNPDTVTGVVSRRSGYGDFSSAVSLAYYGLNHRGTGNPIPINKDHFGMTFFTRPRMNLSYDNLIKDRTFTPMLSTVDKSVARAIRAYLDPVGAWSKNYGSPLVDQENPFIPLLGNNLVSLTGWPDHVVDTYTSKEGGYREEVSFIDGFAKIYSSFELTANFRNLVLDPISYLFYVWTQYAAFVHEGLMNPWPEMILENEIDYNTRIYRLIMDPGKQYVQKIGAVGASFPTSNSLGAHFNFNKDKPYNDEVDEISISFKCMGAIYMDPILVKEFNETVTTFNVAMEDGAREQFYVKLNQAEKVLFNYFGYPRINPTTMELEWWVKKEIYNRVMKGNEAI